MRIIEEVEKNSNGEEKVFELIKELLLKEAFSEENKKLKILSDKEIIDSLKPENYLGATDKIVDRVVKRLKR